MTTDTPATLTPADATALRRIGDAAALPFPECDLALRQVARELDIEARRRVGVAFDEHRQRLAARLGHDLAVLHWESAIVAAPPPRPWREPTSRRRAIERLDEVGHLARRDDDVVAALMLTAVGGERLASASARLCSAYGAAERTVEARERDAVQQAAAAAQAERDRVVRDVTMSAAYRQRLAEALDERNRARAEWERLRKWIDQHDAEELLVLTTAPSNGGSAGTATPLPAPALAAQPEQPAGLEAPPPADGGFLDDDAF